MKKMGKILTKDRIVIPGTVIAEGMDYLPSKFTFREGEKIISSVSGILKIDGRVINVVPLSGPYMPKAGDMVIGKVSDITFSGWQIDIGAPYNANLSLKDASSDYIERGADLSKIYTFDDLVFAKVTKVVGTKIIDLSMVGPGLRKLGPGKIVKISPSKVPRVIGKQGSMITMIKEQTGCNIYVGQNGLVWINGNNPEDELKAEKAVLKVEEESHIEGLTDKMESYLKNGNK